MGSVSKPLLSFGTRLEEENDIDHHSKGEIASFTSDNISTIGADFERFA